MTPGLRTRRLTLRPLGGSMDVDAVANWLSEYDVARWLTLVPWPYTRGDAAWFVEDYSQRAENQPVWAIDAGAGLIGVISVKPELGYWLAKPFHGQGYMSEAVNAVVSWAFEQGEKTLISGHYIDNQASRHVLCKAGFTDTHQETVTHHADRKPKLLQRMHLLRTQWVQSEPSVRPAMC